MISIVIPAYNEERNLARNVMEAYYGLVQARKQAEISS